jgi:hypothetical protein
MNQVYRLESPTLGIQTTNQRESAPVLVPNGELVTVTGESGAFAVCTWKGSEVLLLANDIQQRGRLLLAAET